MKFNCSSAAPPLLQRSRNGARKVAKDAAAIEDIAAPEALEKILQSIEFGNARALRSAGLRVDFTRDLQIRELELNRTLTDNEQVQLRYNTVMAAAANIQGAAAAASGSAEAQSKALAREVNELKEAVGEQFQEYLKSWVAHLRELVAARAAAREVRPGRDPRFRL